jgi:hypothetical protein
MMMGGMGMGGMGMGAGGAGFRSHNFKNHMAGWTPGVMGGAAGGASKDEPVSRFAGAGTRGTGPVLIDVEGVDDDDELL